MELIQQNLQHILALMVLIARAADIGSTYLATPTFQLEANPFMRRFRWPLAGLSLITAFVPYVSVPAAVVVIVMSLLIAFSNSTRLWIIRALGEQAYFELMMRATANASVKSTIACLLLPALFISLLGILLVVLYPDPNLQLGFFIAMGIFMYALVLIAYLPKTFFRLRSLSKRNASLKL